VTHAHLSADECSTDLRSDLEHRVERAFRAFVLDPRFPCLGAKSAVHLRSYRLEVYHSLGSETDARKLARDIAEFSAASPSDADNFSAFVAVFPHAPPEDEIAFERCLWKQLQLLHQADVMKHEWAEDVSSDPADPEFSFSVSGRAFFVVGLHPRSSRLARRFQWPALVFNPHSQFAHLREGGRFDGLRSAIRSRDTALQGSPNPSLADFGDVSEARQYSGRETPADWSCPFHRKTT
jgi:FPC/CPF motif-containing protein YcgG